MGARPNIPIKEILKSIPGFFGIRLEAEPKYDVVSKRGDVEIRRYHAAVVAEVTVSGQHDDAIDEAFRRLAAYIFGENTSADTLAMTVPVITRNERLPMTIPVTQRADDGGWTMAFFLGNDISVAEAPKPVDPGIHVRKDPPRLVAVLRYSGNNSEEKQRETRTKLLQAIEAEASEYRVAADVYWAQYDAPFVLPFVKRNEAQVEVVRRGD